MSKMRLLDLFCGAGGAAYGYILAGYHVTGVDIRPQPRYRGQAFLQGDALEYLTAHGHEYDLIHASPPCQGYSRLRHLPWIRGKTYPLLIPAVRALCQQAGVPSVIENVEDAPLDPSIVLCGTMFGLPLYRHRRFELSHWLLAPAHASHTQVLCPGRRTLAQRYRRGVRRDVTGTWPDHQASAAMGIDWMTREELSQAIPPMYTEYIGRQLLAALERKERAYV